MFSRFIEGMSKSFGEVIKQLMKEKNLSVSQLAKAINCPAKTVQEWLGPHGRMPRDPKHLKTLAEHFNISVHHLLYGEDDPKSTINAIFDKTEVHSGTYELTIKRINIKGGQRE